MQGKKLNEFIDSLYFNPEMEFTFSNKCFLISGYCENNECIESYYSQGFKRYSNIF